MTVKRILNLRVVQWACLVLFASLLILPAMPEGGPSELSEYQVKAAYLVNFGRFVEWPPEAIGREFVIAVLGDDPFGPYLDYAVKGKSINGKRMVIQRLGRGDILTRCQVLFNAGSEAGRMSEIRSDLIGRPVLTVSDFKGFVDRGGMIGLMLKNTQVGFQVNLRPVGASHLTISSRLLALAVSVKR